MKLILSEKNIVVVLFVMVLVAFSLAHEDSRKMEKMYSGVIATTASHLIAEQPTLKVKAMVPEKSLAVEE